MIAKMVAAKGSTSVFGPNLVLLIGSGKR